ncbi:ParB N-terminal domain-containing protein [Motiliproteus sp. MSK22-1]|uniref:ParB N-terminal domain-containing protein n=1 Tax=Motiliproteus sp. MSK22-1 TaxID=1897630 RepID=UPI0009762CF0|nr:ParB N-terminal domain-containing protein [Motiliproteus sp. MSK22-1]OMH33823.1 hypothetical protein BGP75_12605 [Motiliproteus sp. MSK22-1]
MFSQLPLTLVPTGALNITEEYIPERVLWLVEKIRREKVWSTPVTLEKNSLAIMDGHHRAEAAKRLGLPFIPCLLLDYSQVEVQSRIDNVVVTPERIIQRAVKGVPYPAKTTQHIFPAKLPDCNISLNFYLGEDIDQKTA